MKSITQFQSKKVLVLGLAKSGVAAAKLLHRLGAFVTVNDAKPFEENKEAQALLEEGLTVICGRHPEDLLDEGFEYVIKNPGIPYSNPIIQDAMKRKIPVWTEIELAYRISEAPFVGITGSNGKTTTTTILFHMLNQGNLHPLIAGNIGTVASEVAQEATASNVIVTELSSFQLKGTETFRPRIAIWTNLYEAHLDYHDSFEEYGQSKFQITAHQTAADILIYNADQDIVSKFAQKSKATLFPFTKKGKSEIGISADETAIYYEGEYLFDRDKIALPGEHNLENILCATAAALLLGCPKETIHDVVTSFTGVKHRTQFVREWEGRKFYNDSKATNTLATKSALEAFDAPIVLIAGGLDRGHSFEELKPYMSRIKTVIGIGETKDRFIHFVNENGVTNSYKANSMDEAVSLATKHSVQGDVILLSPACASWDQYASFEVRGDAFISAVLQLDEELLKG